MFPGFHKFRLTKESVLIGTRQDLVAGGSCQTADEDESGNMKRMTRRDSTSLEYCVYRYNWFP